MLTHDVLESQTTLELPAREMLFFNTNWAAVFANQQAYNSSTQINAVGIGQANASSQTNLQTQIVSVNQN
jgi:hypothetical protein